MSPKSAVPSPPGNGLPVPLHLETPCLRIQAHLPFDAYLSYLFQGFLRIVFRLFEIHCKIMVVETTNPAQDSLVGSQHTRLTQD